MKKSNPPRKIPLYDISLSQKTIKHVNDTLKSGWLSPGPKVAAFEKKICELMQTRYGAAVSSATGVTHPSGKRMRLRRGLFTRAKRCCREVDSGSTITWGMGLGSRLLGAPFSRLSWPKGRPVQPRWP